MIQPGNQPSQVWLQLSRYGKRHNVFNCSLRLHYQKSEISPARSLSIVLKRSVYRCIAMCHVQTEVCIPDCIRVLFQMLVPAAGSSAEPQLGQQQPGMERQIVRGRRPQLATSHHQLTLHVRGEATQATPHHQLPISPVSQSGGVGTMVRIEDYFVKVIFGWGILAAMFTSGPVKVNVFVDANRQEQSGGKMQSQWNNNKQRNHLFYKRKQSFHVQKANDKIQYC